MLEHLEFQWRIPQPALDRSISTLDLTNREQIILDLITKGVSEPNILWILGLSLLELRQTTRSIERKLGTEDLAVAGALLHEREGSLSFTASAHETEQQLRVLTGARVIKPIIQGEYCGLTMLLADGTPIHAWFYVSPELDLPATLRLAWSETDEFLGTDEIRPLLSKLHEALGQPHTTKELISGILSDFVDQASKLIAEIRDNPQYEETDQSITMGQVFPEIPEIPEISQFTEINEIKSTAESTQRVEQSTQESFQICDVTELDQNTPPAKTETETSIDASSDHIFYKRDNSSVQLLYEAIEEIVSSIPARSRLALANKLIVDLRDPLSFNRRVRNSKYFRDATYSQLEILRSRSKTKTHFSILEKLESAFSLLFSEPEIVERDIF